MVTGKHRTVDLNDRIGPLSALKLELTLRTVKTNRAYFHATRHRAFTDFSPLPRYNFYMKLNPRFNGLWLRVCRISPAGLKAIATVLLLCCLAWPGVVAAQHWSLEDTIVITDVNVVDVRTGEIRADQVVIIERNKIIAAGARKDTRYPRNAPTVNAKGGYLIPGLWDMHVHLAFGDWFPNAEQISLPLFIANGITGVRDMGSELDVVQNWRNAIESGTLIGPRIVTSGPMLDGPKPRFPSSLAIGTPEEGRRAVDELKKRGADFIKLQSLIPADAVQAIAEESKKEEIAFEGHVPDAVRAEAMSDAGMHSFEHLIGIFEGSSPLESEFLKGGKTEAKFLASYDAERAGKLAAVLAKNQTWQCPTLVWERGGNLIDTVDFGKDARAKYVPAYWKDKTWKTETAAVERDFGSDDLATRKSFVAKELEVVLTLHKVGVPFLAGTDTPPGVYIFPGFSLHEELGRFVAAGFTPLEALQTATINPAKFLGSEKLNGTIEKGKYADMVLLDANPLADIGNTQKIAAVIFNGRYFSRAELARLLAKVEENAKKDVVKAEGGSLF
jgi:imidazolonepropionase-like amidohydrolase